MVQSVPLPGSPLLPAPSPAPPPTFLGLLGPGVPARNREWPPRRDVPLRLRLE